MNINNIINDKECLIKILFTSSTTKNYTFFCALTSYINEIVVDKAELKLYHNLLTEWAKSFKLPAKVIKEVLAGGGEIMSVYKRSSLIASSFNIMLERQYGDKHKKLDYWVKNTCYIKAERAIKMLDESPSGASIPLASFEIILKRYKTDIIVGSKDGKPLIKTIPMYKALFEHPDLHVVTKRSYAPGKPLFFYTDGVKGERILNTFHFPTRNRNELFISEEDYNYQYKQAEEFFFTDLGKIIPNAEQAKHLRQVLAHIVQKPEERIDYSIILYSVSQGTGKSFLCQLARSIIGAHQSYVCDINRITTANFNQFTKGTLFVEVPEVKTNASYQKAEVLKSIITDKTGEVNVKWQAEETIPYYFRLFMTTNHLTALKIATSGRRYSVLHVREKTRDEEKEKEYKDILDKGWNYFKDPAFLCAAMDMLQDINISSFDPHEPIETTVKTQAILSSETDHEAVCKGLILSRLKLIKKKINCTYQTKKSKEKTLSKNPLYFYNVDVFIQQFKEVCEKNSERYGYLLSDKKLSKKIIDTMYHMNHNVIKINRETHWDIFWLGEDIFSFEELYKMLTDTYIDKQAHMSIERQIFFNMPKPYTTKAS